MSARSTMTMRARIERDANAGIADEFDWRVHRDDVPCLLWDRSGNEATGEGRRVGNEEWRALVPRGTSVTRLDRFIRVTDRRGVVVPAPYPLDIDLVLYRPDHLELVLKSVTV